MDATASTPATPAPAAKSGGIPTWLIVAGVGIAVWWFFLRDKRPTT